ncbi:MAG: MFS transporter, partial [Vibrio sp.]
ASFGPRLYIKLSKTIATELIIRVCFTLLCICGVLTIVAGHLSPYLFAIFAALATFSTIATRIPGTNLMLEQQDKDTGSAAAIIQFCSMMCGAFGMMLVSIRPESLIVNLGMIQLITGVIAGGLWLIIRHKDYVVEALNKFKS